MKTSAEYKVFAKLKLVKYEINSLKNNELLLSMFTLSKLSNWVARFRSNFMPW